MKNLLYLLVITTLAIPLFYSCTDISGLENKIDNLDERVAALEKLTAQLNVDIASMKVVVSALQNNDFVTSVSEIKESGKVVGYTVTFVKSGKISLYNGKDGVTPKLEARLHPADGIYYWWLNDNWVTDNDGSWLRVEGAKGEAGADGKDGTPPKLKIENGFWMLSTDNGETWRNIGKAIGEPGADGATPVVGIRQFTDGMYYWTLNGEFMLDDAGNKIKAQGENGQDGTPGIDGITPQLKIENGFWMLSTDNGETWTNMGTAVGGDGDSFFQNVTQDDNYVYMQLKDGSMIKLPKEKSLSISFDEWQNIAITGGATKTLNYTVTGATSETIVKALGQNGWRATVTPVDNTTGTIAVTAPDPITDDEVLVWVYDGKTKTIMSSLNFVTGVITVASNAYSLPKEAVSQQVTVNTNIDYVVDIPEDAKSWLSVASTRSAMRTETLTFNLTENKGFTRFATVTLKNNAGKVLQSIAFEQAGGAVSVNVETPGTLSTLITEDQKQNAIKLMVSGTLNSDDFLVIKQMPSLEYVDMSTITNTAVLAAMFEGNLVIKEVKLPAQLTALPDKLFYNSKIQTCVIPNQVTAIGVQSFGNCAELAGQLILPATLTTIGSGAFIGCSKLSGNLILPEKVTSVGSLTFSGCSGIAKIYSKNPTPPALESSVFPNYNNLGVPVGAKAGYEAYASSNPAHDKWSNFTLIEEVDFSTL